MSPIWRWLWEEDISGVGHCEGKGEEVQSSSVLVALVVLVTLDES